uniref:U-scoloptoxin(14)-Sm1a n=1 Tax=Scolopendra morsitans TaxID=943129 RepID=TXE1A_SCOMO|nr:RecName: Full=U-scoloptoxin(14)-Sm1a; Short=U-SLPTX(14)-Sm1a; Flags: Precursor [Scolopendra morsitans]
MNPKLCMLLLVCLMAFYVIETVQAKLTGECPAELEKECLNRRCASPCCKNNKCHCGCGRKK